MKLGDFLKSEGQVGEIVVIREHGWQIGLTRVDNEGLYIHGINPLLLERYDVIEFGWDSREWATEDVLVIDILMDREAINNA